MPKRTIDDRISEYSSKIKKLQQKKNRQKRRRVIYTSEESEGNQDLENITFHFPQDEENNDTGQEITIELSSPEKVYDEPTQLGDYALEDNSCHELAPEPTIAYGHLESQPSTSKEPAPAASPDDVPLEPELLLALGEFTDDTPEYGPKIHQSLATLWLPLLKKGLTKENKEKLLKSYLIPDNCRFLQSPKLNAEISAAVSEIVRARDKKLSGFQQQLGAGITAVNRGMEILLNSDNKAKALTHFSDSCRLLTELHYTWTKDRKKLITPSLEKNILHVIQDSERDDNLFGSNLSEKIKASKAITRQGLQIRNKPNPGYAPRQSTPYRSNAPQGNWRGPPRYPTSRGGRANQTRPWLNRRPFNYNSATAKPPAQTKPRAPTQP